MTRKVAFVTGASRGIGKVVAVFLARAGYDVAITARTVVEGEPREHSSTIKASNTKPLPGSLNSTADLIRAEGRECMSLQADLLDFASLGAAAATVLERWGRVDVVFNNGRYIGPGHMDKFLETPIELLKKAMEANVWAPLALAKLFLPGMIERGHGAIINMTSSAAVASPLKPAGEGGWGMQYGVSKGAIHRVAGFLHVELGHKGIFATNIDPGLIATERIATDLPEFNYGEPAEVIGAVVKWLLENPKDAAKYNGGTVPAQYVCHDLKLLPGWSGPKPNSAAANFDRHGAIMDDLTRG